MTKTNNYYEEILNNNCKKCKIDSFNNYILDFYIKNKEKIDELNKNKEKIKELQKIFNIENNKIIVKLGENNNIIEYNLTYSIIKNKDFVYSYIEYIKCCKKKFINIYKKNIENIKNAIIDYNYMIIEFQKNKKTLKTLGDDYNIYKKHDIYIKNLLRFNLFLLEKIT